MTTAPRIAPAVLSETSAATKPARKNWRDYEWLAMSPVFIVHLLPFLAIFTGVTWQSLVVAAVMFWGRIFAVTAFHHRYFSHRTYKTSRWFQFVMAFVAQTSCQRGVLWWAAHHRKHHLHSDDERDLHSVRQDGFWHAHMFWVYDHNSETDMKRVQDFAKYPELRFLDRFFLLPPLVVGFGIWLAFGWPGLLIGFLASTALNWHATWVINSLCHVFGNRRWDTKDDSKNNLWLALLTFGEGWHNNHHHYMNSVRQGFYWWEIDITYYILKAMSWVGLVWDLKEPPKRLLEEGLRRDAEKAAKSEKKLAAG
jgi:stearoyl-CoA desaturase (delta-9 desaturase)